MPGHRAITDADVERLERTLDRFNDGLPPLKEFILPGGGPAAAACHLARTVTRRAERRVWALTRVETVAPEVAAVPEPAVGPAVRDRARARAARVGQRSALEEAPAAGLGRPDRPASARFARASSSAEHTSRAPSASRGVARVSVSEDIE